MQGKDFTHSLSVPNTRFILFCMSEAHLLFCCGREAFRIVGLTFGGKFARLGLILETALRPLGNGFTSF